MRPSSLNKGKDANPVDAWTQQRQLHTSPQTTMEEGLHVVSAQPGKANPGLGLPSNEVTSELQLAATPNIEGSAEGNNASPSAAFFNYCMYGDTTRFASDFLSLVPPVHQQPETRTVTPSELAEGCQNRTFEPFQVGGQETGQTFITIPDMPKGGSGSSPLSCHLIDDLVEATTDSNRIDQTAVGVFDVMDSLISEANSSPFSFVSPASSSILAKQTAPSLAMYGKQQTNNLKGKIVQPGEDPYTGTPSPKMSLGPYSRISQNIVGLHEAQNAAFDIADPLSFEPKKAPKVAAGSIRKARAPGTDDGKGKPRAVSAPTKRKPRTYTRATPSQHCHVCSRRPTEASPHAACGNLAHGMCRKTICQKCFLKYGWNLEEARQANKTGWLCPHCQGICPDRAQCHIYDRTSERRRNKTVNHRKPKVSTAPSKPASASEIEVGAKGSDAQKAFSGVIGAERLPSQPGKKASKKKDVKLAIERGSIALSKNLDVQSPGQGSTAMHVNETTSPAFAAHLEQGHSPASAVAASKKFMEDMKARGMLARSHVCGNLQKQASSGPGRSTAIGPRSTAKGYRKANPARVSIGRNPNAGEQALEGILSSLNEPLLPVSEIPIQGLEQAGNESAVADIIAYGAQQSPSDLFHLGLDDMEVYAESNNLPNGSADGCPL